MRRTLPGIGGILSIKAIWPWALAILCWSLSGSVLAQQDVEAGRLKADTCLGCHGIPGYTNVYPTYHVPKLGGQHADYIVAALQAYKTGQRDHDTMHAQAAALSDKDMQDIAAYFESLGTTVPPAKAAPPKTAKTDAAASPAGTGGSQKSADPAGGAEAVGKQTYTQVCSTCHDAGTAGAPKLGDKTAWQPRIAQGNATLYKHALNGLGAMPAKGGDASLSDADVQAAVDYMVSEAGGDAGGAQQSKAAGGKSTKQAQSAPRSGAGAAGAGIEQAAARGATPENKSVYQTVCSACHDSGAAGAPKITDTGAWQARTAKGVQALYASAIGGIGAMPAKGGNPQLSEAEVKQAVDYILAEVAGGQSVTAAAAKQPQSAKQKKGQ